MEIASLLVTADADISPADRKLGQLDARIDKTAANADSVFSRVGQRAFTGLETEFLRIERRIPVVGGLIAGLTGELLKVDKGSDSLRRATSELGKLQEQAAKVRAATSLKLTDFGDELSKKFGGKVDTGFLKQFSGAEGELKKLSLLSEKFGNDLPYEKLNKLQKPIEQAAAQFTRLERDGGRAISAIDAEVKTAARDVAALSTQGVGLAGSFLASAGVIVGAGALIVGSVAAVSAGLFELAQHTAEAGSKIYDLSRATGLSAGTLSALTLAAELSGTSVDKLVQGYAKFTRTIGQAENGGRQAIATLVQLGVKPAEAARDSEAAFDKVLKKILELPPGTQRAIEAQRAFGRAGANVVETLEKTGGNIEALKQKARELGRYFDDEGAAKARAFANQITYLQSKIEGIGYSIGQEVLPEVSRAVDDIGAALGGNEHQWASWGSAIADKAAYVRAIIAQLSAEMRSLFSRDIITPGLPGKRGDEAFDESLRQSDIARGKLIEVGKPLPPLVAAQGQADLESQLRLFHRGGLEEKEPKGGGGGRHKAKDESGKRFREELEGLKIVEEAEKRTFARRTADEEYFYRNGLASLKGYTEARRQLAARQFGASFVVANKELDAAQNSGLKGKERENAVAKAMDKIRALQEKYRDELIDIDRQSIDSQRGIDIQGWQDRIAYMQTAASGAAEIYQREADEGVRSYTDAQQRIASAQAEILVAQGEAIRNQLNGLSDESPDAKRLKAQLEVSEKELQNFRARSAKDAEASRRLEVQRTLQYAEDLSSIYDRVTDIERSALDERLRLFAASTSHLVAAGRARLAFELQSENIRARREQQSLERAVAAERAKAQAPEQTARKIAALNRQIEAADAAHYARLSALAEEFLNTQREKLRKFSDTFADIIADGSQKGWKSALDDLRQWLDQAEREVLKSQLFKALKGVFNLQTAEESKDGKAGTGRTSGILGAISKALHIDGLGADSPQVQAFADNTGATRENTAAMLSLSAAVTGAHASSANGGGNVLGGLLDRLLHRGASPQASTPGFNPNAQNSTPGAITQAGHAAVDAVRGAGEAQSGAINDTGKATTAGLTGISQSLLQGLSGIAQMIAVGNSRGSFWKGLFAAAAMGAVNGALGAAFAPSSSGGGSSSSGGGLHEVGHSGGFASGGLLNGPGTTTSDSILGVDPRSGRAVAAVSTGEFVVNAEATAKNLAALEHINRFGELPAFARGGFFGSMRARMDAALARSSSGAAYPSGRRRALGDYGFEYTPPYKLAAGGAVGSGEVGGLDDYVPPTAQGTYRSGSAAQQVINHHYYKFEVHARDAETVFKSKRQLQKQLYSAVRDASDHR